MNEQPPKFRKMRENSYPVSIHEVRGKDLKNTFANQIHWHDCLEICYIESGKCVLCIDGRSVEGKEGDLIVVTPNSIHYTEVQDEESLRGLQTFLVYIHPDFLKKVFPAYSSYYFTNEDNSAPEDTKGLMSHILLHRGQIRSDSDLEWELLHLIVDAVQTGIQRKEELLLSQEAWKPECIKDILDYIDMHYGETLRESIIAERFYISKNYFPKFFKTNTGFTFTDYVKRVRLGKAKELLLTTDDSILSISLKCGFGEAGRFTAAFKQLYGLTPLQYRKSEKGRI